jgi:hypothetical protein
LGFVHVNLRRVLGLLDLRKRETVALLHVENRVVAENERNALILGSALLAFRGALGKLLVKDNRRSVFAFADIAFQRLGLLEPKPERGAVFTRPKELHTSAGPSGTESDGWVRIANGVTNDGNTLKRT